MGILIADELSADELDQLEGPIEIRDKNGRRLGYYALTKLRLEPRIDEAELQRRLADTTSPTFTADEIAAKMRELKKCSQ